MDSVSIVMVALAAWLLCGAWLYFMHRYRRAARDVRATAPATSFSRDASTFGANADGAAPRRRMGAAV